MDIQDKEVTENEKPTFNQIHKSSLKEYDLIKNIKNKNMKMGVLSFFDLGDLTNWNRFGESEEEKEKNLKQESYVLLKWLSSVGDPDWNNWDRKKSKTPPLKDNNLTGIQLLMVNEFLNKNYDILINNPKLFFYLYCKTISNKSKMNHNWLGTFKREKQYPNVTKLIRNLYPFAGIDEMYNCIHANTKNDFVDLAKKFGYDDKFITEMLKEFK